MRMTSEFASFDCGLKRFIICGRRSIVAAELFILYRKHLHAACMASLLVI